MRNNMREIKFRAWSPKFKTMVFMSLLPTGDKTVQETYVYSETTLMQYTGLQDKNGKEIYEGDVVRVTDDVGNKDNIEMKWSSKRGNHMIGYWAGFSVLDRKSEEAEVIGNIYENPELLKS